MDPVSAAGIAMSAVSLSFDVFAGCVKGFVLLSTARNLGTDATFLRTMLNVEEFRFVQWAETVGLTSENPRILRRLNQTLAENLMAQLQEKLKSSSLKERYKLELTPSLSAERDMPDTTGLHVSDAEGILAQAVSDERRGEILSRAKLIQSKNSLPKRLWWAAVDKERFEELVQDLRKIIDALWDLLEPVRQLELREKLERTLSTVIKISKDIDGLKALQASFSTHSALTADISIAAGLKAIKVQLPSEADSSTDVTHSSPRVQTKTTSVHAPRSLDSSLLKRLGDKHGSSGCYTAEYASKPVLVEYKGLPPRMKAKLRLRARNLATFLSTPRHQSFLALKCLGFLEYEDEFAFVYEYPAEAFIDGQSAPPTKFRSLQNLLSDAKFSQPSATTRVKLALDICRTVQAIYTAGWLHKNIRSENILFFPSVRGDNDTNQLSRPYLTGFTFAREDSATAISDQASADPLFDIYRHPHALGEPSLSYQPYMDLYSLGTVLIEIAEWRSLKHIVKKCVDVNKPHVDVPLAAIADIQSWLVREHVDNGRAAFRMGDVYASGLALLLRPRSTAPGTQEEDGSSDLLTLRAYVERLSRCCL